ncbi:inactive protein kinase SELMODRAFT_444075-like [Fagus crenata]
MEGSERQRRATTNKVSHKVLVAVKAEKVISKNALAWALTHVVHRGDCITLLAVVSKEKTSRRFWNFPICTGGYRCSQRDKLPEQNIHKISESCSQMALQFHNQFEVRVRITVVSSSPGGAVAAEAKSNGFNWVILDKKLKQELKQCMEELQCNIVVMKGCQPKVLRLNLRSSDELQTPFFAAASSPGIDVEKLQGHKMKDSTPLSSPGEPSTSHTRTTLESTQWSFDTKRSLFLDNRKNRLFERLHNGIHKSTGTQRDMNCPLSALELDRQRFTTLSKPPTSSVARNQKSVLRIPQNHSIEKSPLSPSTNEIRSLASKSLLDQDMRTNRVRINQAIQGEHPINSSIRDAVSISRTSSTPPPLCSLCQHKAPVFGKPPRHFSYKELEEATDGFSDINFLAEGGFSVVHRGMLRDGQGVAVKRLKFGGSKSHADFCREVRILSCAQHKNVALLIGFCIEAKKRVLVYEYICNGSLDYQLHGKNITPLDWQSRLKIAIGTARALRYIHEDYRVGCIVHRDLRPNKILLTHEFEPLVAGFGLARWHSEWDLSTEGHAIRTSGYLAPEYVDGGQITNKVDVYAFGVILLELMTGKRMEELQYINRQQFLSKWFLPLAALEPGHVMAMNYQLLDPNLAGDQSLDFPRQLEAMGRAASLCLHQDPESRPLMSKVLRVLEGGDSVPLGLDLDTVGSRSGHLGGVSSGRQPGLRRSHSRTLSH